MQVYVLATNYQKETAPYGAVSLSINLSTGWQRLKKEGGFVPSDSVGVLSTVGVVGSKSKKIWREFDVLAIFILLY